MRNKKYYVLNFMVAFLSVYGVVMFLPILPILQEHFSVSVTTISWLPNIGYINMIVFAPVVGFLAKKIKINKLLLLTVFIWITGIGIELFAYNQGSFGIFAMGRFFEGMGEAACMPLLFVVNKEILVDEKSNKFGASMIELGAAIGGLLAGILAGTMAHKFNLFLAIPIILGLITIAFIFTAIEDIKKKEEVVAGNRVQENNRLYLSLLVLIFMVQAVFVASQVYISYYLRVYDKVAASGLVIALEQIAIAVGAVAPLFLLKIFKVETVKNIIIGGFLIGVGILSLSGSYVISIGALLLVCFVVGIAFTTINIAIGDVVKNNVSQKLAIYATIRTLGGLVLSICWGKIIGNYILHSNDYGTLFSKLYLGVVILVAVLAIISLTLQFRGKKMEKAKNVKELCNN